MGTPSHHRYLYVHRIESNPFGYRFRPLAKGSSIEATSNLSDGIAEQEDLRSALRGIRCVPSSADGSFSVRSLRDRSEGRGSLRTHVEEEGPTTFRRTNGSLGGKSIDGWMARRFLGKIATLLESILRALDPPFVFRWERHEVRATTHRGVVSSQGNEKGGRVRLARTFGGSLGCRCVWRGVSEGEGSST